jgi:HEAT repeat protein
MAKSRQLEELLAALAQVRAAPTSETGIATLRRILNSKYANAIAQAAKLVKDHEIALLVPELVAAFHRCLVKPVETDPSCKAKERIADALYHLAYGEEDFFLTGIHHVQPEPVWGGSIDTAAALRGVCALGLVRMNYAEMMTELADLLADPEPIARSAAAQAIAYSESPQGIPLLRLKIQLGDPEPSVMGDCFTALLKLAPTQSLSLVARYLEQPQLAELAALALGESRRPEALEILKTWWQTTRDAELQQTGLLAIATLRQPESIDFLMTLLETGPARVAKAALAALDIYPQTAEIWQRVQQITQARRDLFGAIAAQEPSAPAQD